MVTGKNSAYDWVRPKAAFHGNDGIEGIIGKKSIEITDCKGIISPIPANSFYAPTLPHTLSDLR